MGYRKSFLNSLHTFNNMKRGSKKSPIQRNPKTKEQIAGEMKRNQSRTFIKESFYPALKDATISVDEAGMLLQATVALIMEEAMDTLRAKKMKEIRNRIVEKLCPDDERLLKIEALISLFDNQSLFETRGHLESMRALITQMQSDEMKSRGLDTMNPDWDRYLTHE